MLISFQCATPDFSCGMGSEGMPREMARCAGAQHSGPLNH